MISTDPAVLTEIGDESTPEIDPLESVGQASPKPAAKPEPVRFYALASAPSDLRNVGEERLISRCRGGDSEACAALLRRYAGLIYSTARRSFGMSQDDADDIYQLCFMKVLDRASQFRGDSKFSAWLRTVVRNICVDCIRSQKPTTSLDAMRDNCENCPLGMVCGVEEFIGQAEERSVLDRALGKLPDHYRRPIQLFFLEDKSYKEISEILDEPVNTVGTHINRGLARLRKDLASDPDSVSALVA